MSKIIKEYFLFSRRELSAIIILVVVIVAFFVAPNIINTYTSKTKVDFSKFDKEISQLDYDVEDKKEKKLVEPIKTQLFTFDPNTVSAKELKRFGFSPQSTKALINYRKSGASFKTVKDLKRVYGISNSFYNKIKPYVSINNNSQAQTKSQPDTPLIDVNKTKSLDSGEACKLIVELNSIDSLGLKKLSGIGSVFSKRIINYRDFLGGFYSKKQLLEVYGFSKEKYQAIEKNVQVNKNLITKINLNTSSFATINKHPYITKTHTKMLLNYRKLMGRFDSLSNILENNLMDTASYIKVKPYLFID